MVFGTAVPPLIRPVMNATIDRAPAPTAKYVLLIDQLLVSVSDAYQNIDTAHNEVPQSPFQHGPFFVPLKGVDANGH